jgi:hypothetical protein
MLEERQFTLDRPTLHSEIEVGEVGCFSFENIVR